MIEDVAFTLQSAGVLAVIMADVRQNRAPGLAARLALWACACDSVAALLQVAEGNLLLAGACALLAVLSWLRYRKQRRRDRAPRSYGAKSRARLARLLRSMPRLAPRLQPQGARA